MTDERLDSADEQRAVKQGFRLFRYFQFVSLAAIAVILIVAVIGLRFIFRGLVLHEAERDAIRVSNSLRDSEMRRFIQFYQDDKQYLSIPEEQLPEMDQHVRVYLSPFDIVKIKIFNNETRIIYSTDSKIIGRLDPNNAKLAVALGGMPISKHESKDNVWDLDDEERKNVEIVETYVPIRNPDGRVIGSFEIYKDVTYDLLRADRALVRAGAVLSVTILSVFAVLMSVIHRATRVIKTGTAELTAANKQLLQEITQRKRIEQSLRETQERFGDFFENAPVGFHFFGPDRMFLDINAAELQMIGYTKDEIVGKQTWADLVIPEQRAEFERHWRDIITQGEVRNLKYILVHKDGHHVDVVLNASARFDGKGNLLNTRGSVLNVTERKRLEKQLLSIIERERRRIGQELHDSIGQQLTGIEFMTEALEQKLSSKSLPEASYAAKITTCVAQTTEQTRELAKGLHPVDLDENGLMSALEELTATTEHLFGVSCTLRCDRLVPINDSSVAINLYRIAQEAITNAIKHGRAKNILVELSSSGDCSKLTVENDGLNFPQAQTRSEGMGLKVMNYRAEMIDATLNICTGTNSGTIVTCVFPNTKHSQ